MNTTPVEVEEILDRRLREANLSKFVNREQSQVLDFPDQVFVEIVLTDASYLSEVGKIVRNTAQEVKERNIRVDAVIRAVWEIVDVSYFGPSRSADGGLRAAYEFHVKLKSGDRQHSVAVDVFWGAMEFLQQKLGLEKFLPQARNTEGHLNEEMVAKTIRSFVQHQLSLGGTSYWDPLLYPRLEMNDAAMLFVLGQTTIFNELRQAISDAFEPPVVHSFFRGLAVSGKKTRNFYDVLTELSNLLGGAYGRGQIFSTNASELFQKLDRSEQELLKNYFYARLEQLKAKSPELLENLL